MNSEHKAAVKELIGWYGVAKVVKEMHDHCVESCRTDYADNPGAIIHRDTVSLSRCLNELGNNHPIFGRLLIED